MYMLGIKHCLEGRMVNKKSGVDYSFLNFYFRSWGANQGLCTC